MVDDEKYSGQWVGRSYPAGEQPTFIMVNVESRTPTLAQVIGVNPQYQVRTLCRGSIEQSGQKVTGKTWDFKVYDRPSDSFVALPEYSKRMGDDTPKPTRSEYEATLQGRKMVGQFKNDLGQDGHFEVWKSFSEASTGVSAPPPETIGPMTWEDFKKHVNVFRSRGKILFRGQHSNKYPLITSFHRLGRNDLIRYFDEDVFKLRHQVNSISSHYYHPGGEDLLGLLSLAQHHGFPTPLLDWTESPYVAAFFAFNCLSSMSDWYKNKEALPVRIFTFDLEEWRKLEKLWAQTLRDPWPDFQFFHPPAHNNPRYYPQQSMAAFSNVEDIEGFVRAFEIQHSKKFLTRIDIHAGEREHVEEELRFMGISAATLFPGFEGVCKSLRAELF